MLASGGFIIYYLASFADTSRAGFSFVWGVSLTDPVLTSYLSGDFLLHIPCWLHFCLGSFSYISRADFIFIGGFCYTSRADLIFVWGVSLTHPMLASFVHGCFSYTSDAVFIFVWGVSLTHPVLGSIIF